MPTVSVGRDRLFAALGRSYTQEEFEDLCFSFGIELDDVTTEKAVISKEKHLEEEKPCADDEIIYKIEVPANRYDLLCLEGLAQALRIFNGLEKIPRYTVAKISKESMHKMHVKNFRADELMEFYKSDLKLKKFLHIIENSSVFPVIYDCNRTVLSLPPIINGAHSAITLKTKNVFIECTATDLTKAKIVLNTMVTTFATYCERKFEVEPVEVISFDGNSSVYPDLSEYNMEVPLSYITGSIGVPLEVDEVTNLLKRMQLNAEKAASEVHSISVSVPPTRSDILHPCDVMEDVAIAYGYNNIPKRMLSSLKPLPLNHLSDLIRSEIAMSGFTEVLTWILCSKKENFEMLNRKDDKSTAVIIGNPRSSDFEVVRTSLMPGMLKTVGHNKDHPKPIKIYEVGDVVLLDEKKDVVMGTPFVPVGDKSGYYIELSDEPEFLSGRQAKIIYKGRRIGIFGIVHPEVLNNFDIPDPCSFVELDIENFL
ncbi:putative phenylalanine--tRNA ligase beta subunit [Hibiscus syriacus]|uniref:phenylalanine--tRNA ligase n=1 Tax=Hibiscus syriacus TaxID=106335 RepID=A0A6A3AXY8_HIBSY|nr:putative phenylalanine--tRNA ligase beta subunit [Hibiscus syriacus]